MVDRIIPIIENSKVVALVTPSKEQTDSTGQAKVLQISIEFREVLRGATGDAASHSLVVPVSGKGTPHLEPGSTYLLFLVSSKEPLDDSSVSWELVAMSEPVLVPDELRSAYLSNMKDYLAIEAEKPDSEGMKNHIFRMLESGINFFQYDAALEAQDIEGWSSDEIDQLIAAVRGTSEHPTMTDLTHEAVTYVIVSKGTRIQLLPYAREELLAGNGDDIYYGLRTHDSASSDSIILEFMVDADIRVRTEAIRLAGLLRRSAMLDAVEEQTKTGAEDDETKARLLNAVDEARALVDRD